MLEHNSKLNLVRIGSDITISSLKEIGSGLLASFHGIIGEIAIATVIRTLPEESEECPDCEFLPHCRGYFKWPERDYSCKGVKEIFRTLKNAAKGLKKDYVASLERAGENKT